MSNISIEILLIVCLISIACTQNEKKEVHHPLVEHLLDDTYFDNTHELNRASLSDSVPMYFYETELDSIGTIGNNSISKLEYIRLPRKIDIDNAGNVYILNYDQHTIDVYSSNAHYVTSIGRWGRGPGEFEEIVSFDFDSSFEYLYVLDSMEIEIFKKQGEMYEYHTSFKHGLFEETSDICVLDDNIYVSGFTISKTELDSINTINNLIKKSKALNALRARKPISKYRKGDLEFDIDFGFQYISASGFGGWTGLMSATLLECKVSKGSEYILGTLEFLPYTFGYNSTGEEYWATNLINFRPTESTEFFMPGGYSDHISFTNEQIFDIYLSYREIHHPYLVLLQIAELQPQYSSNEIKSLIPPKSENYKNLLINIINGKVFETTNDANFVIAQNKNYLLTADYDLIEQKYLLHYFKLRK